MKTVFTFLALTMAITAMPKTTLAQNVDCGTEEVQALFCPAMKDEALYDKNGFDSYKMLVPGTGGWIFRSESDFRINFSIPDETLDDLERLSNGFKRHGTNLVMLITPTRAMMHSEYITAQDKKKYGLTNIDQVWDNYWKAIQSIRTRGVTVVGVERPEMDTAFFYKRDHHWNTYGAQQAAKALAAEIKKMEAYKDIPRVEYVTRDNGPYDFFGVSKKVFKRLCDTRQTPERIVAKLTEKETSSDGEDELFGEASQPQIVLMGTSNSTMEPSQANFEGFLNEELSADILNTSVSGGGLDTAMISYLNSSEFKNAPAKIAIWEVPGYYDLSNHKKFFREAIPAVYGSCEGKALAMAKDKKVNDKTIIALEKLASKKISGGDYYLGLNFSKPVMEPMTVDFRYIKNRDKYKFDRSKRAPDHEQFFVSLNGNKKESIEKIVLNLPEEAKGATFNAMLCKINDKKMLGIFGQPKHASDEKTQPQKVKL